MRIQEAIIITLRSDFLLRQVPCMLLISVPTIKHFIGIARIEQIVRVLYLGRHLFLDELGHSISHRF